MIETKSSDNMFIMYVTGFGLIFLFVCLFILKN